MNKDTLEKVMKLTTYIEVIDTIADGLSEYVKYPLRTLTANSLALCNDIEDDILKETE